MRSTRPLRIGYARVFHEGNAFSPQRTHREAFERFHTLAGPELAHRASWRGVELEGFLRFAELSGFVEAARRAGDVEAVPLFSTMTVPSGKITAETFAWIRERLRSALAGAGALDGVYLALHGSMMVEDLATAPEGVLIGDVQEATGGAPVAASFDLHGNLSSAIADPLTVLTAYRTNPHRDLFGTGLRAGRTLIRALRGEVRPTHAWRKLPMVLGGGTTVDFLSPMRGVFRHLRALERQPGILGAHLFMVHPYSDAEDLGWAVHVTTDGDATLAERTADALADRIFALRHVPIPELLDPQAALAEVRRRHLGRRTGAISLVDTSDIVGAGSPGGSTHLIAHLLQQPGALRVYAPVQDAALVEALWHLPVGSEVDAILRGVPTGAGEPEVPLRGVLAARCTNESGRVVRVDVDRVSIAVTERLPLTIAPRFWREIGLSPWRADAIVQKTFFHYRFFYAASNRGNVPVRTAGPTSIDRVASRTFDLPVWPSSPVDEWRTFDAARRAPPTAARAASA